MSEFETKMTRVRALLEKHQLDALLLQRISSFAWASCGGLSYISTAAVTGEAFLIVTRSGERHLITNNIEAPHYEKEHGLKAAGWQFHVAPWYATNPAIDEITRGMKLGSDAPYPGATDLSAEVARLRLDLTPEEQQRFRAVCADGGAAMGTAAKAVRPGMTEMEIGGLIEIETRRLNLQSVVTLVATDERIFNFRHPLPTTKKLDKYAMLITCARRGGLVMAATRFVHFGKLSDEVRRKAGAVAQVDAMAMAATRPGRTLGQIFADIQAAYASVGFPGEWQLHHQGGSIGYETREFVANTANSAEEVHLGQAYAWNPSITGTKSEDTMLVTPQGVEVLTASPDWPMYQIEAGGQMIARPAILEVL